MSPFFALVKREYWENKGALRTTPLVIGGLMIVIVLMSLFTTAHFDNDLYTFKEGMRYIASQSEEDKALWFYQLGLGASTFFTVVLGIVVFFYLLGALYDDRKDRSILFWKSLPTSDLMTMGSKLFTAMVVAPLIFWVVIVLTSLLVIAIMSLMILMAGVNPLDVFVSLGSLFKIWGLILASFLTSSIWFLPLYGWLLLVSAYAPRLPLLFAIIPVIIITVLQQWIVFLRTFTLQDSLASVIGGWISKSPAILTAEFDNNGGRPALGIPFRTGFDHEVTVTNMLDRIFSMHMVGGLLVAAVLLAAAWWVRRRATEK